MSEPTEEQRAYLAGALHGIFLAWHQLSLHYRALIEQTEEIDLDALLVRHLGYLEALSQAIAGLPDPPEAAARTALYAMMQSRIRQIRAFLEERAGDIQAADDATEAAIEDFHAGHDRLLGLPPPPESLEGNGELRE